MTNAVFKNRRLADRPVSFDLPSFRDLRHPRTEITAVLLAVLALLLLGPLGACTCGPVAKAPCKGPEDCSSGLCIEGLCSDPPACSPACSSKEICETTATPARCVPVVCDPACGAEETCLVSDAKGRCVALQTTIQEIPEAKARLILPGSYLRGSPTTEEGRNPDEGPQHKVTFTRAFWMLQTEVTQGQYKALIGENPSHHQTCGDTCPVEQVTWSMAALWANALSTKQGLPSCFSCQGTGITAACKAASTQQAYLACKGWRLPTEAEWEYAARAGTTGPRYNEIDTLAWYQKNSGYKTRLVGGKGANAWGLYDMLGNVWEWVYDSDHVYKDAPQIDPIEPREYDVRIQRGGAWNSQPLLVRAASRSRGSMDGADGWMGFRCVKTF